MKRKLCWLFYLLMMTQLNRPLYADEVSHRAAAERLLEAMQTKEMMAKQVESMRKMIDGILPMSNISKEPASEIVARQSRMMDFIYKNMSWDILKPDFVRAYMEVFTETEMKELTSFYKSPIGLKLLEKTPELTAKTMQLSQKRIMALLPEIQKMATEPPGEVKKDSDKR
jgi:uncharacterized protein